MDELRDRPEATLARWRGAIDAELRAVASSVPGLPRGLGEAIHYSLTSGGKRLRGLLLLASYHAARGRGNAAGLAAAVEVVHAYSLVHDDLPCMDNDSLRRGRPTTHKAFDVPTATIAGVAMVPLAVAQTLRAARALGLAEDVTRALVRELMRASGASGMVGGQLLDLAGEGRDLSVTDLETIHRAKTGALIAAALVMGGLAARAPAPALAALSRAGSAVGLAFQIADDVLDATASTEVLGKTARHDAALAKSTYATVLGVDLARSRGEALVSDAMTELAAAGLHTAPLDHLAHFVAARQS